MENLINFKKHIYIFFIFILTLNPLKASIVVDFEEVSDGKMKGKTRVIVMNTESQSLILYKETVKEFKENIDSYSLNIKFKPYVIDLDFQSAPKWPIIIRSQEPVKFNSSTGMKISEMNNINFSNYIYSSQEIKVKYIEDINLILEKLKKRKMIKELPPFPIDLDDKTSQTLQSISLNNKGKLGELCATLTMLSFGYYQHPTKYGGDKGFDGVFESLDNKYLFLTESKQEKKQRTPENIMKNFLNEIKIRKKIEDMERLGDHDVKETAKRIKKFFQENNKYIFKFAYRMMDKGIAEFCIDKFNIKELIFIEGIKLFKAPIEEKIKSIQDLLSIFEENTDQKIELSLKSIDPYISEEKIKSIQDLLNTSEKNYNKEPDVFLMPVRPDPLKNQDIKPKEFKNIPVDIQPIKNNPKNFYNRNNLFEFLNHLKIKHGASNIKKNTSVSLSTIKRILKDKNYAAQKDYKFLWNEILKEYPEEFKKWSK